MKTLILALLAGAAIGGATWAGAQQRSAPELAYQVTEGQNLNAFLRDGPVAAHLLLRNGSDPRILVAFPAGNSGVGLWFEPLARPATWRLEQPPRAAIAGDTAKRQAHAAASSSACMSSSLSPK